MNEFSPGPDMDADLSPWLERINTRQAVVGVVGLGYVGLPLAMEFAAAGFPVIGLDTDSARVASINRGERCLGHFPPEAVPRFLAQGGRATGDFAQIASCGAVLICVPTPLTRQREPDMSYIASAMDSIAGRLQRGALVILESTTWPGTTREMVGSRLASRGWTIGRDLFVAYSPEREDPGNARYSTRSIPKVVGGMTASCLRLARALYDAAIGAGTVPVSSPEAAEAAKLLENIFRCVNIAMVNELKMVFDRMDIDIWEVVAAARTKPFGFMPFYPGPGLGGHCIPVDPFYLAWKAREFRCSTRFIELAGEINIAMPEYVVERLAGALNARRKPLRDAQILLLGLAYKKNIDDTRESPSLRLMELLEERGAVASYHDPHIPVAPDGKRQSVALTEESVAGYDAVLVATDHDGIDYGLVGRAARLVVDTRNAMAGVPGATAQIVKA